MEGRSNCSRCKHCVYIRLDAIQLRALWAITLCVVTPHAFANVRRHKALAKMAKVWRGWSIYVAGLNYLFWGVSKGVVGNYKQLISSKRSALSVVLSANVRDANEQRKVWKIRCCVGRTFWLSNETDSRHPKSTSPNENFSTTFRGTFRGANATLRNPKKMSCMAVIDIAMCQQKLVARLCCLTAFFCQPKSHTLDSICLLLHKLNAHSCSIRWGSSYFWVCIISCWQLHKFNNRQITQVFSVFGFVRLYYFASTLSYCYDTFAGNAAQVAVEASATTWSSLANIVGPVDGLYASTCKCGVAPSRTKITTAF